MSVIPLHCLNCGGKASSTANRDEYICQNCGKMFQIVRPADGTVMTDTRAHHCPICGRPVEVTQSYKCTECGKVDFCEVCVTSITGRETGVQRFVCKSCMVQRGWACSTCGNMTVATCIRCKRRACRQHMATAFAIQRYSEARYFTCPVCRGVLCNSCVEVKVGILSAKYYCKRCRTELNWSMQGVVVQSAAPLHPSPPATSNKTCPNCGASNPTHAKFCRKCGTSF